MAACDEMSHCRCKQHVLIWLCCVFLHDWWHCITRGDKNFRYWNVRFHKEYVCPLITGGKRPSWCHLKPSAGNSLQTTRSSVSCWLAQEEGNEWFYGLNTFVTLYPTNSLILFSGFSGSHLYRCYIRLAKQNSDIPFSWKDVQTSVFSVSNHTCEAL